MYKKCIFLSFNEWKQLDPTGIKKWPILAPPPTPQHSTTTALARDVAGILKRRSSYSTLVSYLFSEY